MNELAAVSYGDRWAIKPLINTYTSTRYGWKEKRKMKSGRSKLTPVFSSLQKCRSQFEIRKLVRYCFSCYLKLSFECCCSCQFFSPLYHRRSIVIYYLVFEEPIYKHITISLKLLCLCVCVNWDGVNSSMKPNQAKR